jgi:Lysyl oxidase
MRRARRSVGSIVLALASLVAFGSIVPSASAASAPSVRLFAAADHVTASVGRNGRVSLDPGIWVGSVAGAFELRAGRPDYDTPVSLVQTDAATGAVLRDLPVELLDGWNGLKDFLHISVRDDRGHLVYRTPTTWCPNAYGRSRIHDGGPLVATYPQFCGGGPFTKGMVYGIDDGWAVSATGNYGYGSLQFRATRSRYVVSMWIDPAWADALAIPEADASTSVNVRVIRHGRDGIAPPVAPDVAPSPSVPTTTQPPADATPNIVALPAWGVQTYTNGRRDFLAFNATEWNAGPGTLEVEGFRQPNEDKMDAFQYFLEDGQPVARSTVGQLEFHEAHQHWHFEQFTQYSLLDADSGQVRVSTKRSWCLGNTDGIDLSVPNANWQAYGGDIFTMCGGPGAIWIREVLDVGWGDTYGQYIPGQAFNITDLPNGNYYIRVQVNPENLLYETSMDDNVQDRLVMLRGTPGDRRVVVPPWHGIDTEHSCVYCGGTGSS